MKKMLLIAVLSGCVTANMGENAEANQTQRLSIIRSIDQTYTDAVRAAAEMKWEITHSEKEAYLIQAKTPQVLSRWEDNVTVTLDTVGDSTVVTVKSRLGQKPNRDHVSEYLDRIRSSG